MLGLENLTQSWVRLIIVLFCCFAELLLVCAAFVLPVWEISGTPGYVDSGPVTETYLFQSPDRSKLYGIPLLLTVLMGLMAGLAVPLVHFFGANIVKWAYTKASSLEFGSEFLATKISDTLFGQCVASLMSTMFTAAFLIWSLKEKDESFSGGFYCIVGLWPFTIAATALKWYLPWAPADPGEDADETQNFWGGHTEDAAEDSPDDSEAGNKRSWWNKKASTSDKAEERKDSNASDSIDNESIQSEEQPKRGWFW